MTSLSMTSLNIDLNEAAKYVDIIPHTTHIASLLIAPLHTRTTYKKGDDVWPNLRRLIVAFMKVRGMKTWKELMFGLQQFVRLLFNNHVIDLSFK